MARLDKLEADSARLRKLEDCPSEDDRALEARQPATHASTEPASGFGPAGECQAYEEWRPALIAFYLRDCCPQKAVNLRRGEPFDYLDIRTIEALQAAANLIPERKAA